MASKDLQLYISKRKYKAPKFKRIKIREFDEPDESEIPQLVSKSKSVSTAAISSNTDQGGRTIQNTQAAVVTLWRKIRLVHAPNDPLTADVKIRIEEATRKNFCLRIAMHLREYSAFRKQKLVIELTPAEKLNLTAQEQTDKIKELTKQNLELLKEFETRDYNVGLPEKLKTVAWQCWQYGRNLLIIMYADEKWTKPKDLFQINSRRLAEPVLDEDNDLKFEGCIVDGSGLDKDSMIYAVYQDRELSPHTEGYGYSIVETVLPQAEIHSLIVEDGKEIAMSAFLPSILLKVLTEGLVTGDKTTRISTVMDAIDPGRITGVPAEQVEEAQMLDLNPNYEGLVKFTDSYETQIYNAFHVPLFMVKSDEIANRATANKSAKIFLEGVVADDQAWMENLLGKQWYDPLLREALKKNDKLTETVTDKTLSTKTDTSAPKGTEAPLPFLIRRKFEAPTVEDFVDLAESLASLKQNGIWDVTKANEMLNTEEVTTRVMAEQKKREDEMKAAGVQLDEKGKPIPQKPASFQKKDEKPEE